MNDTEVVHYGMGSQNLAGVAINDQQIDILFPGAGEDQWTFDMDIDLVRYTQRELIVEAWDWAGHRTGYDRILRLDAR